MNNILTVEKEFGVKKTPLFEIQASNFALIIGSSTVCWTVYLYSFN